MMFRTGRHSTLWAAYLLAGLATILAYFALAAVGPQNVTYDALGLSAVVAILVGVRIQRPALRLPWYLLALGDGFAVAGDMVWTFDENVRGVVTPFPSFADVLYLGSYVIIFVAVLLLVRGWSGPAGRAALIDTAIITVGAAAVVWTFLIDPHWDDTTRSLLDRLVSGAYPAMDLLTLAAAVRLALEHTRRTVALHLLIASLVANLISDIFYTVLSAQNLYHTGHPVDLGWLLAYVLLGVGALHPSMRAYPGAASAQSTDLPVGRLPIFAAAALTGPALLTIQTMRGAELDVPIIVGASATLFLLVLARLRLLSDELQRREARFHALIRYSSDIVAVIDAAGVVHYVSAAAQRVLGYAPQDIARRLIVEFVHPDDIAQARDDIACLRDRSSRTRPFELRLRDHAGAWRQLEIVGTNLLDEPSVGGIVLNCRDITIRRQTEAALRESESGLATAQRLAGLGNWAWERGSGGVRCSVELYRLFGFRPGQVVPHYRRFLDAVHPADRGRVRRWARALYRGEATSIEHRIIRSDGEVRVVQQQVEVTHEPTSAAGLRSASGTVLDITERARAQETERFLARAGEHLAATLDFDATLDLAARLVVPTFADWCVVDLLDADGALDRVVVHHADLALSETAREFQRHRLERDRAPVAASVLRSSAPGAGGADAIDLAAEISGDEEQLGLCRALGVAAYIATPLRIGSRMLGALTIVAADPTRRYDARDLALVEDLARRVALALDNTALHRALAAREYELQDLVGRLLQEQEDERRRVAYDIHDGLAQLAASTHQHLQAFDYQHRPRSPQEQQDLDQLLSVTQQTVQEARRVIANLRPIALDDFGLGVALRRQVEYLRAQGWQIAYRDGLGGERFPPTLEASLYRVAQEALNNVRKHARTTCAAISIEQLGRAIILQVRDEGIGFAPKLAQDGDEAGERIGLRGMRERLALLSGTLTVTSRPGEGTQVVASVPLPPVRP